MTSELKEKMQPVGDAVIFLLYRNGKVLLEERVKEGSGYFGYNIIPGGKVESTDLDSEAAMLREINEEMGILAGNFTHLDSFLEMSLSGNFRRNHAFLVEDFHGEVVNREPEKGRLFWVPIEEAKKRLDLASSKYIIDLARGILQI